MNFLRLPMAVFAVVAAAACSGQTVRPLITGVSHLAVYTAHPAEAEHFYVHDLGLKRGPDPENSGGVRYYVNQRQFVEVLPLVSGRGDSRLDDIGFLTPDAQALRAYLAAHGYPVPSRVETGADGSRWFDVNDPEGNKVEFNQPAPNSISMAGANPIGLHMIHVGVVVRDAAKEDAFYRGLLGFRPYWRGGMKAGRTDWISQEVPDGYDWLEYMLVASGAAITRKDYGVLDHFSLGIVNMEKAVTTLSAGSRLDARHTPMQIGRDGKWQFNLYAPNETRVELMEFTPVEKPCCSPFTAPNPPPTEH